jgi:hypothetical protein
VGNGLSTYLYEVYIYRAVNGNYFNDTKALTVNLTCNSTVICSVPPSVTIPEGSSYAYFQVDGLGLGNTTITASAVGYSSPLQDMSVNVVSPQLNFNGPADTLVNGQSDFSVYVSVPGAAYSQAATSVLPIDVTSSAPGVATISATVSIDVGSSTSDTGQVTGVAPGTTTFTASGPGLQSVTSRTITITP